MILKVIAGLHRSGMQVDFGKSVAVLAIRGKAAAGIKKRYVKWRDGHYVIAIGTDSVTGREVYLPIEDKMEYLGVILSYGADCAISRGQSLEQFLSPGSGGGSAWRDQRAYLVPQDKEEIVDSGLRKAVFFLQIELFVRSRPAANPLVRCEITLPSGWSFRITCAT